MMKRTGVPRLGPDEPSPLPPQAVSQMQQAGASSMHNMGQSAQPQILGATAMLSVGAGFRSARPASSAAPVINYLKNVTYAAPHKPQPPRLKIPHTAHQPLPPTSLSVVGGTVGGVGGPPPVGRQSPAAGPPPPPGAQFQRLKVEDALSYLDQVKYKFNTQPQVYNDFLDIMKEFKSQTIDTPGVITRVSNLFKGHPELIVGFNTFLPPGYKIEVQSNGQVSVSMPSPTGMGTVPIGSVNVNVSAVPVSALGPPAACPSGVPGVPACPTGVPGVVLGVHHPPQQLVHLLPVAQTSVSSAIVHNLSVSGGGGGGGVGGGGNTLHHISAAHQQIEAAIHHTPNVHDNGSAGAHAAGQPVEFNHAIEYVNKIKSRFSRQPDKYKRFLEILHAYQRGHRDVKETQAKQQTEQEVYSQVAKLFENQEDLLAEFGQFLPDAKAVTKPTHYPPHARTPPMMSQLTESSPERYTPLSSGSPPLSSLAHHATSGAGHGTHAGHGAHTGHGTHAGHTVGAHQHQATLLPHHVQPMPKHTTSVSTSTPQHHLKRSPSFSSSTQLSSIPGAPPPKKPRPSALSGAAVRDVSLAEAARLATAHDYRLFERVRKACRSHQVYDNFLRCLLLFTNEIISGSELLGVARPFLSRSPDLVAALADFVAPASPPHTPTIQHQGYNSTPFVSASLLPYERERERERAEPKRYEPIGAYGAQLRNDRPQGDAALDIDLTTCKRLGTSYCALPREAAARRCSGRTPLCKEVLNDTWVSFPTWSEDSTFVTSRKTQYEEYIYRCEDERFELDVVIETNASTIRVLEGVQKKLSRMSLEEAARYRLDECLGGHSPTIHQRALRRIYGDKVAVDIIAGLKKNPVVAVPVVLRRLKAKEEEWREAQKGFNKQWREQNEKYYLKSLDHQGINFKQNDLKAMRSKSLFNEVESAYAARRPGPHLCVDYGMTSRQEAIKIVRDTADLLIHHARRQTAIQKAEKRRIKQLLRQFLPDLFNHPRQPLSDDERDEEEKEDVTSPNREDAEKDDKANTTDKVKMEKQESSESDNASDKSSNNKNHKNDKENKPKNNNTHTHDVKDSTNPNAVKRSSSNEECLGKSEIKTEDPEDDFKDHPANEARFVATSSWYLFLRLHGVLCARLAAARRAALDVRDECVAGARCPQVAHALRLKPNNLPSDASSPSEYYTALLELVKGVLDGNTEPSAYEDAAREMLGIKAYPAYTMDKLVSSAVRQLQHCVSESWSVRAAEMAWRGMRGPLGYVRRAAKLLRREHAAFLIKVYGGDECRVTFELLESAGEGRTSPANNDGSRMSPTSQTRPSTTNGEAVSRLAAWSLYTERYSRPDLSAAPPPPRNRPVFLRRCARRCGATGAVTHASSCTPSGEGVAAGHQRRKTPRILDAAECTLANTVRLLSSRPHHLYRPGSLSAARSSQPRLSAARRDRFKAWLRRTRPDK